MIAWLKARIQYVLDHWNQFWFSSRSDNDLIALSIFRISFCAVMLICYIGRAFDLDFFYGANGILPGWHLKNMEIARFHPTIITDAWKSSWLHGLHSLFLLSIFLQMLGLCTRFFSILTYLLHMIFVNRNLGVMFGVDMIADFYFLYLCFAQSNTHYSIDAWRKKAGLNHSAISHIAFRLMQIQLCIIYAFSGLEKLKGTRWWDGSAIWDVMSIGNMQRWDLSFLSHVPILLAASTYVVLFFEIYFPVLIWQKKWRLPLLGFGLIMHLGVFIFMNLPSFGFLMISLYILFLQKEEIQKTLSWFGKIKRPSHS